MPLSTLNRSLLPATLLGTLVLAGAAHAGTIPTTDYAVSIEGTASYNRADVDGDASAQHDLDLTFRTEVPKLTFHGNVAEDSRGARGFAGVTRGSYLITGESGQLRCTTHDLEDVTGGGFDATHGAQGTTFATRVIDAMVVRVGGCQDPMPPWQFAVGSGSDPVGVGLFDGSFVLPHSRIGEDVLEFPLQGEVSGAGCPFNHHNTVLCSMTWEAKVRFVKTGTGAESDEVEPVPVVPAPAPAPTPAPVPPAPTAPQTDDDLLVPLVPVPARASLSRDLTKASLPLACNAACRGTVTATAGGRTLARTAFRAAAGRTTVARLRFDAADRRAIRRAGGVRLTVRGTAGGRTIRKATTLRRR